MQFAHAAIRPILILRDVRQGRQRPQWTRSEIQVKAMQFVVPCAPAFSNNAR